MLKGIEYHGRLTRRDGRPANPGTYSLQFALHADERTRRTSWTEALQDVQVAPGGFYSVVLGLERPMKVEHFKDAPRWLSVRVVRKGEAAEESGPRSPMVGTQVRLLDALERLEKRVVKLEEYRLAQADEPSTKRLAERLDKVEGRVTIVSDGDLPALVRRVERLVARLDDIDVEDGRLDKLEDRMEDFDGEDGDVVDLNERMDALEKTLGARTRDLG